MPSDDLVCSPEAGDVRQLRQLVEDLEVSLRDSEALLQSHADAVRRRGMEALDLGATCAELTIQNGRLVQALITLSTTEGMTRWVQERRARGDDVGDIDWATHMANTALASVSLDHAEEAALLQDIAAAADVWDQAITNLNGIADSEATLRAMVARWRRERARKAGSA